MTGSGRTSTTPEAFDCFLGNNDRSQVHDDALTYPADVQAIYDNIAAVDKKLYLIQTPT
jgi:hypothetical protein